MNIAIFVHTSARENARFMTDSRNIREKQTELADLECASGSAEKDTEREGG